LKVIGCTLNNDFLKIPCPQLPKSVKIFVCILLPSVLLRGRNCELEDQNERG